LENLVSSSELSLIDKEYIEYYILAKNIGIFLNHQNFDKAKDLF
jgi:hypothetical protein